MSLFEDYKIKVDENLKEQILAKLIVHKQNIISQIQKHILEAAEKGQTEFSGRFLVTEVSEPDANSIVKLFKEQGIAGTVRSYDSLSSRTIFIDFDWSNLLKT